MKRTNRNAWSKEELQVLQTSVTNSKSVSKGIAQASKKLGRSAGACTQKYYSAFYSKNSTKFEGSSQFKFKIKSLIIKDGYVSIQVS